MSKSNQIKKVLVIGSGPIIIGQGAEFDYSGSQCCLALQEEGIEIILVNNNPATIMTDERENQKVYCEAITVENMEKIIELERPDSLIVNMGGQTSLNMALKLHDLGIIEKYNLTILGTPVEKIRQGEDRKLFRELMVEINEPIIESTIIDDINQIEIFIKNTSYPVIVRPAYTLGGRGGGIANTEEELIRLLNDGLASSPIKQVIAEKSLLGYKEIEMEIIRDKEGNCVCVCDMENMDPVGIHTGDSIVFAPCQTVSKELLIILKEVSYKIVDALEIIGGCNIQFAVDKETNDYYLIEVNPRVSRSSALASKATGYPIARVATKLALGYTLKELDSLFDKPYKVAINPNIDYVVGKFPVWPFEKLNYKDTVLTTKMKATGEIMVIDKSVTALFGKYLSTFNDFSWDKTDTEQLLNLIQTPTHNRLGQIIELLGRDIKEDVIYELTDIQPFFLTSLIPLASSIHRFKTKTYSDSDIEIALINQLDKKFISRLIGEFTLPTVRKSYHMVKSKDKNGIKIDNYLYSTYKELSDLKPVQGNKKIAILGSSAITIGQGVEFDYCTVKVIQRLKKLGYQTIMINDNPETVSTDYEIADRLYFEPLTVDSCLDILRFEQIEECFVQFGGQTALNVGLELEKNGIRLIGISGDQINIFEDRERFYHLLDELAITHPNGLIAHNKEMAINHTFTYPIIVRPSFVIGGKGMEVFNDISRYNQWLQKMSEEQFPILIDDFIDGLEVEVDLLSDGEDIYIPNIIKHVEGSGVHSGDSISIYPMDMPDVFSEINQICREIVLKTSFVGIMNIQFIVTEENIYCIEVNPRASRTIPIISKIMNISLIDKVIDIIMENKKLSNMDFQPLNRIGIKVPYFSYHSLSELDSLLGPNMKSTGEGLFIGVTIEEAKTKLLDIIKEKEIIFSKKEEEQLLRSKALAQGSVVTTRMETYQFYKDADDNLLTIPCVLNGKLKEIVSL